MTSSEILSDAPKEIPRLIPRWLRLPQAVAYSGLSRSRLYVLFTEGQIKAACVKEPGAAKGTRLIDRLSLDEFLERHVPTTENHMEGKYAAAQG
jgi:helix-turn-helix protein